VTVSYGSTQLRDVCLSLDYISNTPRIPPDISITHLEYRMIYQLFVCDVCVALDIKELTVRYA